MTRFEPERMSEKAMTLTSKRPACEAKRLMSSSRNSSRPFGHIAQIIAFETIRSFAFALHPDGERVAETVTAAAGGERSTEPGIVLVTNFFDELKAKFAQR